MDSEWLQMIEARLTEISDALEALTPGSPAYVRGLRDRAVVALMQATLSRADVPIEAAPSQVAEWALRDADALVKALGYEPPGEG